MELSKTHILNHRRCAKLLWLDLHQPELQSPSEDAKRRAEDGRKIGELSRQQLGRVIWISAEDTHRQSAAKARFELMSHVAHVPAVEVPMWHDEVYARADALVPTPVGYRLQETKSQTFKEGKRVDSGLIADAAVQCWVLQSSGLPYAGADLVLIDSDFVYQGEGNYTGLFKVVDVSSEVAALLPSIQEWVDAAHETAMSQTAPEIQMGSFCNNPPCPFKDHCEKQAKAFDDPKRTPVSVLPDLAGKNLAKKLRAKGYQHIQDVPPTELCSNVASTTAVYQRIRLGHITNAPVIEPQAAQAIEAHPYPHAHFDFEGIDHPVPVWKGLRPYEQVTFQFSVHIQHAPGQAFDHHEFLDLSGDDPTLACIEAMDRYLPKTGTIFVYHMTYEASRLREMQGRHPEHAGLIQDWLDRMVDLLPIVKGNYYHPAQRGSYSIKKVLKGICPKLDYAQLQGVHNGTEAQLAYLKAIDPATPQQQREQIRIDLLKYCELDTLSMVKVAQGLRRE